MEQRKITSRASELWAKIKEIKHFKLILAILIAATVCLIYGSYSGQIRSTFFQKDSESVATMTTEETLSTDEEKRLEEMLNRMEGLGKTKVYLTYDAERIPKSAVVLATNAKDAVVEWKIRHAVMTALQIDYHNIDVYSMI